MYVPFSFTALLCCMLHVLIHARVRDIVSDEHVFVVKWNDDMVEINGILYTIMYNKTNE